MTRRQAGSGRGARGRAARNGIGAWAGNGRRRPGPAGECSGSLDPESGASRAVNLEPAECDRRCESPSFRGQSGAHPGDSQAHIVPTGRIKRTPPREPSQPTSSSGAGSNRSSSRRPSRSDLDGARSDIPPAELGSEVHQRHWRPPRAPQTQSAESPRNPGAVQNVMKTQGSETRKAVNAVHTKH